METEAQVTVIRPQPGKQEAFLACGSDIAVYGGGAGSGKTFALLLDFGRWAMKLKGFVAVIFRNSYPEIMNPGALWDESMKLFPLMGAVGSRSETKWVWPNGSWIKFSYMARDDDVHSWQGAQLAGIGFDELTHFSQQMFFYMISRLRTDCGIRPYIRGTCNPDPTSWVAKLLAGWIDENGLPIEGAEKKVRYLARDKGEIVLADDPESIQMLGMKPRSVSFIPALVHDNKILIQNNPDYIDNLKSLSLVDRERLLGGNWKITGAAGMFFKRQWFSKQLDARPLDVQRWVRYWDRAATEVSDKSPDPDWTAGVLMGLLRRGGVIIADVARMRGTPMAVQNFILSTAHADGVDIEIVLEQDPGQAGVAEVDLFIRDLLQGFNVHAKTVNKNKADRAKPLSAQAEAGNVWLVRGPWQTQFMLEAEAFIDERECKAPKGYHDDQIDAASGAYNHLALSPLPSIRSL